MDGHAEAIEADFQRYYQTHIGLLGSEELTWRRFKTLLFRLPRESLFMQETLGEAARWGSQEHLQATTVDLLAMLNHNLVQSHSKRRLKPPKPIRRPGDVDKAHAGEKKLTGKAIPLDQLKALTERWRGTPPEDGEEVPDG